MSVFRVMGICLPAMIFLSSCAGVQESVRNWDAGFLSVEGGADGEREVEVTVDGQPVKFLVDPGFGAMRLLNNSAAQQIGLRPSAIAGGYEIGPVMLTSRSSTAQLDSENYTGPARFHWFGQDVTTRADGLISPVVLPYGTIRFELGPSQIGEEIRSLPLEGSGIYGVSGGYGKLLVRDDIIRVAIDLNVEDAVASADVGALLRETNGGRFVGVSEEREIRYGVVRPVLRLVLDNPLIVAGLRVEWVFVEVERAGMLAQEDSDPETIIVTARTNRNDRDYRLTLGQAQLRSCTFFEFNNQASLLSFNCTFG
ncbi:hypothetical protein [Pontixanthobacter sp.]|uniref:hypothetical protein n=1 Tax=Pontixanthobacter sp. TaxID=2792078 RepID=UPI003C7CA322